MNDTATVLLPGGLWHEGRRHQEARLRTLTGADEAFLQETTEGLPPAAWTSHLLARCLDRLGPWTEVTPAAVGALTAGDREALLLHLRRLTLGDAMPCVLTCPVCDAQMDLDLAASTLLVPPYLDAAPHHEATVPVNGTTYRVRFRLPTGADQEAVAGAARQDPQAAATALLRRCVEAVTDVEGHVVDAEPVLPALAAHLDERMAELDTQAEILLTLACPDCGHTFTTVFDTAAYLRRELAQRTRHLYREVHLLAFYYHWSEREIMSMTSTKRRRYLDLLTEALQP